MKNKYYRLEFNEKTQSFHYDNGTHEPNTYGWETIAEYCTDFELMLFDAYIERKNEKKYTTKKLRQSVIEIRNLIYNLGTYNLKITSKNGK